MNQVSEWFRMTQPRRQHPQNVLKNKFPRGRHSKNWNKFRVGLNQSRFSRCISQFLSYRVLLSRESRLPSTAMTQLLTCTDEFFVKLILRLAVVSLCFRNKQVFFTTSSHSLRLDWNVDTRQLFYFDNKAILVLFACRTGGSDRNFCKCTNCWIFQKQLRFPIVLDFVGGSDGIEDWTFMHSALILKQRLSNSSYYPIREGFTRITIEHLIIFV